MRQLWNLYVRMMRNHPVKTQLITTGTSMLSGDLIAQKLVERRSTVDIPRAARFFAMGIGYNGPVYRAWYLTLDRLIGTGSARAAVVKKVVLDQAVFFPSLFLPGFLVTLGALQRRSWEDIRRKVLTDYVPILKANYVLWPAVQIINFTFVPLSYRLPFGSCVALVWNTYLAWRANLTVQEP
ncbi:mitochondrial inner membrane protein Mpv17-like [Haemaphysalis longicornis]